MFQHRCLIFQVAFCCCYNCLLLQPRHDTCIQWKHRRGSVHIILLYVAFRSINPLTPTQSLQDMGVSTIRRLLVINSGCMGLLVTNEYTDYDLLEDFLTMLIVPNLPWLRCIYENWSKLSLNSFQSQAPSKALLYSGVSSSCNGEKGCYSDPEVSLVKFLLADETSH